MSLSTFKKFGLGLGLGLPLGWFAAQMAWVAAKRPGPVASATATASAPSACSWWVPWPRR